MTGIGIDFGTSYSVVGYADSDGANVIRGDDGAYRVPSVVHLADDEAAVGGRAVAEAIKQPQNTVWSIKRHLGTDNTITIGQTEYHPTDISGIIFKKLRKRAAVELNQKIPTAVVTVPAQYGPAQRRQVEIAANKAGITVSRVLSEPVALCLAHGVQETRDQTLLVLDLGGGTLDVSLVEVAGQFFEVRRTHGHPKLGGDDWDGKIFEWVRDQIHAEHGVEITPEDHPVATQQLFDAISDVKRDLSGSTQTGVINVPQLYGDHPVEDVQYQLTQSTFEEITKPLLKEFLATIDELVQDEDLQYGRYNRLDVDKTILAGGATQMPQIEDALTSEYDDLDLLRLDSPGGGVAMGAAFQSHQLRHNALPSPDTETLDSNVVPKQSPQTDGIAKGTCQQEGIVLAEESPDAIAVVDSAPDTFGWAFTGKRERLQGYVPLIREGSPLPCEGTREDIGSFDPNDRVFHVTVCRGPEGTDPADLETIDRFKVGPVPAQKRLAQSVDITMRMNSSGLLEIQAEIEDQGVQNRAVLDGVASSSTQRMERSEVPKELEERQDTESDDLPKLVD